MTPTPSSSPDAWAAQVEVERSRRQQAEEALAAAEARIAALEQQIAKNATHSQFCQQQLSALVENMRVGLLLVDHEGTIQLVNSYFRELFSLPPEVPIAETYPPIPANTIAIDQAFQNPAEFGARAQAIHAAGETVLSEEFRLANGRVVELDYLVLDKVQAGRLICYRDVTERHQRDAQLRTISYIPKQSPSPILRLTAAGELLYANPAAAPLLQALATDAQGHAQQQLTALVQQALTMADPIQAELDVQGQYYLLTAMAVPNEECAVLYFTDITARRQAEQQVVEQRKFYETILEQVPIAVAVIDADSRYLFVNPSVEPDPEIRRWMIGKTNEESCQHRQRPAAIAQQRRRAFREVLSGKSEMTWEETIEKGQEQRFFLRRLSSAVGPDGSSQLLISSGIDITERKRTEQQMAQQQQFYEAILNLLPVDIAVFDAEHRFLFVNPSSISDPSIRQQVIGKTNYEYMAARRRPMSLADQRQEHFESAVRTKTDVSWEETLTGPKGVKHILRNFRPIFDASGALQLVVGSGIDITARYAAEEGQRQVERQLREQQTFVRLIVDALPDVVYVKDANGQVVFRNAAFDALASRSKQHWQPTEEQSIAVQEELWQIRVLNKQVMATSRPLKTEMSLTMSRGEPCHLQVYMCPMASADGSPGILTVSTDITNLKLARLALEQREKQYHDLVRYSQALICTHDLEGTLLTVNPAIERLLNLPAARLIGRNIREAIPPEHQSAVADYLASTNQPTTEPRLMTIMTSTGERRYLHYYTYQVREADAAPYVVASGYDVTQGIRAERALLQAKQEAEANAHAKESFLSRMSHEIRTPLNGVLGMAVLLEKTTLTPQQQEYLTTMQQAGQHLLALVNDVLDMAKITTHHLQIDQAEFDLVMALQSAGQTVAALATQKGLTLLVEPPTAAMPRVLGDAYRLHQVLLNLLSNALKFTTQGSVQLGASVLADVAESLTVRFWVQDTGIGIEPEHQERIFDAFTQASAATSYRFGGTGLGLAISEQLVHHMGGSLLLCSTPGEGTTFSFTLTLPRVHATTEAAVPVPINYEGLEGLRVLLAEDNVVNQWITTVLLEQRGVLVYAVGTGTEALAQLETKSYDAALLDIQMPGLSGVDVTRAVRQHPDAARASVPLIALTANAFDADQEAYLAAGMNACLTKPFEEDDLYRLLLQVTATATSQ